MLGLHERGAASRGTRVTCWPHGPAGARPGKGMKAGGQAAAAERPLWKPSESRASDLSGFLPQSHWPTGPGLPYRGTVFVI